MEENVRLLNVNNTKLGKMSLKYKLKKTLSTLIN